MTKTTGNFNYLCCAASHHLVFKSNFQPVLGGKKRTFTPQGKVLFNWLTRMTYSYNLICVQLWHPFTAPCFFISPWTHLYLLILLSWTFQAYPIHQELRSDSKSWADFSFLLIFKSQLKYPGNDFYSSTLMIYSCFTVLAQNMALMFALVDGSWSCWSSWSKCSVICGGGHYMRTRTCSNPPPAYGGDICLGLHTEEALCNTQPCPGIHTRTHTDKQPRVPARPPIHHRFIAYFL